MSDFLSNFSKESYDGKKKLASDSKEIEKDSPDVEAEEGTTLVEASVNQPEEAKPTSRSERREKEKVPPVSRYQTEETEFDPTYKKRQRRKYLLIALISLLAVVLLSFTYYQLTHVKVPDFANENISEARSWGSEEGVAIKVNQEYDFDVDINQVISQDVEAGKKIRKGKTLTLASSLGADPEEPIELPNFNELDKSAASAWIEENKANNITLIESFDESIDSGSFIRQEAANKELNLEDYRRKDRLNIYYSKGKEVFEKDINVPDFKGKTLAEVTDWAKKNELKLTVEEEFSKEIPIDQVLSQGTAANDKVAKQEEFVVTVSKGKAIVVPDYSFYTMEEATGIEATIPVVIKSVYSTLTSYGSFISQSVEPGTEYGEGDTIPPVEVVYSEGQPYIKDLRGSVQEGDLPKLFFDEYQSKGAYIYYEVYYVDSYEPKGTVVEMSHYSQFLSIECTIYIGISLGNMSAPIEAPPIIETPPVNEVPEVESYSDVTE